VRRKEQSLFKEPNKPTFEQMELAAGHLIKLHPKAPFIYCKIMELAYEHVMAGAKRARNGEDFYINQDLWALFLVREEWLGRDERTSCPEESQAQEIPPEPLEIQRQNLGRPKMVQQSLL
jgi:hypothetical protein